MINNILNYFKKNDIFIYKGKELKVKKISLNIYSEKNGYPVYFDNGNYLWSNYLNKIINE